MSHTIERYYPITEKTIKYNLDNPLDMVRFVVREGYAWPGGYELGVLFSDGVILCQACLKSNFKQEISDIKEGFNKPEAIVNTCDIEEGGFCENCGI